MNRIHTTIDSMKVKLLETAEKHGMNLLHPEVVAASQELDLLIVQSMKACRRIAS